MSSAGDVNGDGYDDIIIGAYRNSDGGAWAGKANLYLGGPGGLSSSPPRTDIVENTLDYFGDRVYYESDVNGDGYDDVIVGAYRNDEGGS